MFCYQGEKYKFYVLSKPEAQGFLLEDAHIIISISDPYPAQVNFRNDSNIVDVLRLKFHDIDKLRDGYQHMTHEQAIQIVNFVLRYKNQVNTIVFHCEAGLSRSPGAAAAISLWLEGTDSPFYKQHFPNSWVKRIILRALYQMGLV